MNLCEIMVFHIVWGLSRGTCDNYHKILWKNVLGIKYRYISILGVGGEGGGEVTWCTLQFLFIIHKDRKSTRAWPALKSNSTSFWFWKNSFWFWKNCLGCIIKSLRKGPQGASLLFLYEMSIVVLIDFIAILTPGVFLKHK